MQLHGFTENKFAGRRVILVAVALAALIALVLQ